MKNSAPRPGHETEQEHAMNLMNVDYTTKEALKAAPEFKYPK